MFMDFLSKIHHLHYHHHHRHRQQQHHFYRLLQHRNFSQITKIPIKLWNVWCHYIFFAEITTVFQRAIFVMVKMIVVIIPMKILAIVVGSFQIYLFCSEIIQINAFLHLLSFNVFSLHFLQAQIKCNSTTDFQCASGRCVPKSSRCDRIAHCRDRSDERDCLYEPCPKDKFSCANHSQCLDWKEVCDGSIDCKDGKASDELHPDPCPMNVTCPKSTFKCVGTNVCAMPNWMCDGENDCGDNSDENEENCKNFQCPDDWFRCGDNRYLNLD